MAKTRKQQLEGRIAQLESYVFEDNADDTLKKIYEDHAEFLRKELKECSENDK